MEDQRPLHVALQAQHDSSRRTRGVEKDALGIDDGGAGVDDDDDGVDDDGDWAPDVKCLFLFFWAVPLVTAWIHHHRRRCRLYRL